MVTPRVIPGTASFRYTRQTISQGEEPIASAASMRPAGTSARALSTCRPKKGMVAKSSGMIIPRTPMPVPTISRLSSMSRMPSRMKGMERKKSQTRPRIKFTGRFCSTPPSLVVNSSTP